VSSRSRQSRWLTCSGGLEAMSSATIVCPTSGEIIEEHWRGIASGVVSSTPAPRAQCRDAISAWPKWFRGPAATTLCLSCDGSSLLSASVNGWPPISAVPRLHGGISEPAVGCLLIVRFAFRCGLCFLSSRSHPNFVSPSTRDTQSTYRRRFPVSAGSAH
jgi:hypothetical protein